MAIRLRVVPGVGLVALCAARSVEKPGDRYLDDGDHMALARKFWQDYPQVGIEPEADIIAATEAEESNTPNRSEWDRAFAPSARPTPEKENA